MNFKYFKTERLITFLLVLAVLFDLLAAQIESCIDGSPLISKIFDYVDVFSTIGLILLTLAFINFIGWKWKIFKWLIDVPNLNGRYQGELISSYLVNGLPAKKDCVIEIKQTASSIHIYSYYGDPGMNLQTSRAYSASEQLIEEKNELFKLYYIFTNEPDVLQTQLNNHSGTAQFKYYPDIKTLDGDYYNQRKNIGTIKVKFIQEKLLGRLIP